MPTLPHIDRRSGTTGNDTKAMLRGTRLFEHLADATLDVMSKDVKIVHYRSGDVILNEGAVGERLHVVLAGAVRVFTYDKQGSEVVLARLEKGSHFGEQALLATVPTRCNASVRALTEVETLTLTHAAFQNALGTSQDLLRLLTKHGKEQLITKLLNQLTDAGPDSDQLDILVQRVEQYLDRQVFFRQGDAADCAYYLLSGKAEARFFDDDRSLKSRSTMQPGQFFGERGVLENAPRAGTVVALADSEAAVIDARTLRDLYARNLNLNALLDAQRRLYEVPALGVVTQHQGSFLGQLAIHSSIRIETGETITASRLVHSDLFAIRFADTTEDKKLEFRDSEQRSREIVLGEGKVIGVVSIGAWDDLPDVCALVFRKTPITDEQLRQFVNSGRLPAVLRVAPGEGNLCECMQVKARRIQELVLQGSTSVEAISRATGAGTMCGGCRPRIFELLGGDVWTFVRIAHTREHNDHVRSYQLEPITKSVARSLAGQHIVIEGKIDERWVSRCYTLTSTDEHASHYEITVKREEQGMFSRWLFNHDRDDVMLRVSEPQGEFFLEHETPRSALCFVAGIGVTPAIAFGRKLLAGNHGKRLHIDYSVTRGEDLAFNDELAQWPRRSPNITVTVRITSREGRISESAVRDLVAAHPEADAYICGPKAFENSLRAALTKAGMISERIHVEQFAHAGGPIPSLENQNHSSRAEGRHADNA